MQRIKRKIVKAGVQLSVRDAEGRFVPQGYFPNKLEAQQAAAKVHAGKDFRITGVRVDATPMTVRAGSEKSEE